MRMSVINGKLAARFIAGWYVRVSNNDYCVPHSHANWELVFHKHVKGKTCLADGASYAFEGQSIVLYAAGQKHDQIGRRSGVDHCIHLNIHEELAEQLSPCLVSPVIHDNDLITNCLSLTRTRLSRSAASQYALDCQASFVLTRFLQVIQARENTQRSCHDDYVVKAQEYILGNFRKIQSVKSVAEYVGISYDHLRHIFIEHTGITLNQYLINARIERSRQLLEHSTLNQSQIAQMAGLSNEQYFNACFKKIYGLTPGQYRKQVR
jgi:AraC-like DNA-binding protein